MPQKELNYFKVKLIPLSGIIILYVEHLIIQKVTQSVQKTTITLLPCLWLHIILIIIPVIFCTFDNNKINIHH